MKVYIKHGAVGSRIDEEKTEWCCQKFYDWGKSTEIIENVGDKRNCVFNWDKLRFEEVKDWVMLGMGGFGDRFWGDSEIKVCPFCGKKITPLKFFINGDAIKIPRRKLAKALSD